MNFRPIKIFGTIILGIFTVIVIKGFLTPQKAKYDKHLETIKQKEYKGVVAKKYKDKNRHNRSFLMLSNLTEVSINSRAYDKIEINDSITKASGELYLTIYRNNSNLKIKLG